MFAALESSTDVFDCDSIDALQVLSEMCTFVRSSESLPERIHICVAGQCDLAHPEVHQNFNSHVQTHPFAEEMHGSCQNSAYFVFDLTDLLKDNRLHGFSRHTLDGHCLLDSFRTVPTLDPSQHFSFVVVCLLLTWLQRLEGVTDAYVLSVCDQGKHQSVYMGRVVWLAMDLLKRILGLQTEVLYMWVAQERGMFSQQGHLPGRPQRQHPDCCADVVQGWHRFLNSSRYVSVSLTDKLHTHALACEGAGFDLQQCFRDIRIFPLGEFRELLGTEERLLVKFSNLINRENTLHSWLFFIRVGMKALWPECCAVCSSQERRAWTWQKDVPSYFSRLIAGTQQSIEPSPRMSIAARPQRRRAWADVEETREDEEASRGMSLWTASTAAQSSRHARVRRCGLPGKPNQKMRT